MGSGSGSETRSEKWKCYVTSGSQTENKSDSLEVEMRMEVTNGRDLLELNCYKLKIYRCRLDNSGHLKIWRNYLQLKIAHRKKLLKSMAGY